MNRRQAYGKEKTTKLDGDQGRGTAKSGAKTPGILAKEAAAKDPKEQKRLRTQRLALEAEQGNSRAEMQKAYERAVKDKPKPTPIWKNLLWAFCVGGLICTVGQALNLWFSDMGLDEKMAGAGRYIDIDYRHRNILTGIGISMRSAGGPGQARSYL